ncbi:hypothetical protein HDV05_000725 [Chytridiales sp. JEL 0842]|nr:hypothetical protein HDV05_000725 [Chytridiales sp. JEL 0842]
MASDDKKMPWLSPAPPANHATRRWSCELCRSKRRKCDGERPTCSYCNRRGEKCVYLGQGLPKSLRGEEYKSKKRKASSTPKRKGLSTLTPVAAASGSETAEKDATSGEEEDEKSGGSGISDERRDVQTPDGGSPVLSSVDSLSRPSSANNCEQSIVENPLLTDNLPAENVSDSPSMIGKLSYVDSSAAGSGVWESEDSLMSELWKYIDDPQRMPSLDDVSANKDHPDSSELNLLHPEHLKTSPSSSPGPSPYQNINSFASSTAPSVKAGIPVSGRDANSQTDTASDKSPFEFSKLQDIIDAMHTTPLVYFSKEEPPASETENLEHAPAIPLAMCAFGGRFSGAPPEQANWYYEKARGMIPNVMDKPTLEAVQAVLILMITSASLGTFSATWSKLGLAIRMALFLKLDVDPDFLEDTQNLHFIWKESRRRAWWICYVMDGNLSSLAQRPYMIKRGHEQEGGFKVKGICPDNIWYLSNLDNHPIDPTTDEDRLATPTNHTVALTDIYNDVVVYNQFTTGAAPALNNKDRDGWMKAHNLHPGIHTADDDMYVDLEARLSRWVTRAPLELAPFPTLERIALLVAKTERGTSWPVLHSLLTYHRCICMLNYARLTKLANTVSENPSYSKEDLRKGWKAYVAARASALVISNITKTFWVTKTDFMWCSGGLMFSTYQSLLVLILLIGKKGQECMKICEAQEQWATKVREVQEGLYFNSKTIRAVSDHWASAKMMLKNAESMLKATEFHTYNYGQPPPPPPSAIVVSDSSEIKTLWIG